MTNDFRGRSALVSGAGRGIGRSTAIALAHDGVTVILLARTESELNETAALAREHGEAMVIPTDVGDPASVSRAMDEIRDAAIDVDILINNAAVVWPLGATATVDPAEWRAAMQVNVFGAVQLTLGLLPGMLARGWGRVVNVSSGIVSRPGSMIGGNAYATSKAALEAQLLEFGGRVVAAPCEHRRTSIDRERLTPRCRRAIRQPTPVSKSVRPYTSASSTCTRVAP